MSKHILLLIAILGAAACSSSTTPPGGECEPGEVTDCTCQDGTEGSQTCLADGSAFGDCQCAGECEPGDARDCTCEGGASGTQTCNADGTAWGECQCESTAPTALTEAPPPGEIIDAGFPFLAGTDEVSLAMKVLWEEGLKAPATSEEKSASMAAQDAALAVIQDNLADVQAELYNAIDSIEGDDLGLYQTLTPLIQVAGDSPPILAHFQAFAMRELSAAEQEVTHDPVDTALLRGFAMRMLSHQAKRGNSAARNHVMRAVTSPSLKVRRLAVKHYYTIEKSRRRAQRELRLLMSPEDRHLLYLY